MAALASQYWCTGFGLKGYGQSEKKSGDCRHEGVADQLYTALEKIGFVKAKFNLVSHDRGRFRQTISRRYTQKVYCAMGGASNTCIISIPLAPQEAMFMNTGIMADLKQSAIWIYRSVSECPIPEKEFVRVIQEFSYPGIPRAVPRYFNIFTLRAGWLDRRNKVLAAIKCPDVRMEG